MKSKFLCALLALMLTFAVAFGALAADAIPSLTVQGNGVVYMDADQATITVGVRETADDVMAAQSSVNEKISAVIQALTELGIASEDMYTNSINIYPNYDYSSSDEQIVGYTAYNSISALTSDVANVGTYIDAAFAAGANTLDNVEFSASDTDAASEQALKLAVEDATAKAQVLAEAAGMDVWYILSIQEGASYNYGNPTIRYAEMSASDGAAGTQVIASQLQVSATVSMTFAIEDPLS